MLWLVLAAAPSRASTLAQFRTPLGEMDVELFDDTKPVTVRNFLDYVQEGLYQDTFFHRWAPGFVLQGGGYTVAHRGQTNATFALVPTFAPITNEFGVGPRLSNTFGTLAMAKVAGDPDSATSQWFFNLADNSANLDNQNGGFTVFGRVVAGAELLDRFNHSNATNGLYVASAGQLFTQLPVLSLTPGFNDLIYVDITLLHVDVHLTDNGNHRIDWNSVADRTNRVEYTDAFPPDWQTLTATNGTGQRLEALDPATGHPRRFYRVRIDF